MGPTSCNPSSVSACTCVRLGVALLLSSTVGQTVWAPALNFAWRRGRYEISRCAREGVAALGRIGPCAPWGECWRLAPAVGSLAPAPCVCSILLWEDGP